MHQSVAFVHFNLCTLLILILIADFNKAPNNHSLYFAWKSFNLELGHQANILRKHSYRLYNECIHCACILSSLNYIILCACFFIHVQATVFVCINEPNVIRFQHQVMNCFTNNTFFGCFSLFRQIIDDILTKMFFC